MMRVQDVIVTIHTVQSDDPPILWRARLVYWLAGKLGVSCYIVEADVDLEK